MPTHAEVLEQLAEADSMDDCENGPRGTALLLVREAFRRVEATGELSEGDRKMAESIAEARLALNRMHVLLGGQCIPGVEQEMMEAEWTRFRRQIWKRKAPVRDETAGLPLVQDTDIGVLERHPDGTFRMVDDAEYLMIANQLWPAF